jgi:hypothetical protein
VRVEASAFSTVVSFHTSRSVESVKQRFSRAGVASKDGKSRPLRGRGDGEERKRSTLNSQVERGWNAERRTLNAERWQTGDVRFGCRGRTAGATGPLINMPIDALVYNFSVRRSSYLVRLFPLCGRRVCRCSRFRSLRTAGVAKV